MARDSKIAGNAKCSGEINNTLFVIFVKKIYLPKVKFRKRSWKVDERIFRQHIHSFFEGMTLQEIKREDIEKWLNLLPQKGLAFSTCNRILAVMKTICKMAEDLGYYQVSPCRNVKGFHANTGRDTYLSLSQTAQLLNELENNDSLEALALRLILLTGARKNEILKAKWEDVHVDEHMLVVPIAKSGKPGHILLSEAALRVIALIPQNGPYLFPSRRNRNKPLADIYYFWNQVRQKLNLQGIRVHDLRHTYASVLVNSGYSLYVAQKLLGHASPTTTMRYAHFEMATMLDAANQAAQYMIAGARKPSLYPLWEPTGKPSNAQVEELEKCGESTGAGKSNKAESDSLLYATEYKPITLCRNDLDLKRIANMLVEQITAYIYSMITGVQLTSENMFSAKNFGK